VSDMGKTASPAQRLPEGGTAAAAGEPRQPQPAAGPLPTALERCKQAALALTPDERRQLREWLDGAG
jgi:hypothetical protein